MEKLAEAVFQDGLAGPSEFDFSDLSDAELEKVASEEGGEELTERELDSIATRRVFGEVAAHALLHEEEAMKVAMVNGLCRYCKETPLSRAPGTHPTLCPSCTPS
jgi:hypothetical protein